MEGETPLVKSFDLILQSEFDYFIVCPKEHLKQAAVRAFKEWLLTRAGEHVTS